MLRYWAFVIAGAVALLLAPASGQAKSHHRAAPTQKTSRAASHGRAATRVKVAIRTKAPARGKAVPRGRKTTARNVRSNHRGKRGRPVREVARAPVPSWRTRQMAPSSDRYLEIQQALVTKGYLKSGATGAWDSDSQDALRRFQADQHLQQTGKLNSLSLIALGLGPAKSPSPPAPAAQPAP